MTQPPLLQQVDRTFVLYRGRRLSYFSGCDYFRLSSHPSVLRALREGLERFGLTVAASRRTTGNHQLYERLEQDLAAFFGVQGAVVVSNGYVANMAAAQAVAGIFSHGLIDERAHTSLADAALFLRCPVIRFRHRDSDHAARIVRRLGRSAKIILLTDGVFAHDGSVAPLEEYLKVLPRSGVVLVDDAHAAGVIGEHGQGTPEYLGLPRRQIVQTITLGKAFGVYGGAVLGTSSLRRRILHRSHLFVGNTPMPLPLVAAANEAVRVVRTDRKLRARLVENTRYVKESLASAGISINQTPSPIFSLMPQRAREIARLRRRLLAANIYPPHLKYPGGPPEGYFRFALSSEHTWSQLDDLLGALTSRKYAVGIGEHTRPRVSRPAPRRSERARK